MTDAYPAASSEAPITHPEEMRASFDLHVGKHITLEGNARITPAGVICTAIAAATMTLALGYVMASAKRRR